MWTHIVWHTTSLISVKSGAQVLNITEIAQSHVRHFHMVILHWINEICGIQMKMPHIWDCALSVLLDGAPYLANYIRWNKKHTFFLCVFLNFLVHSSTTMHCSKHCIWCVHSVWEAQLKGAQSLLFQCFSNFWRFWYHIFLLTHGKFHSWKGFHLEDTSGNMSWLW